MRQLLTLILLGTSLAALGQATDTTIYKVVETLPRFPGCEEMDTTMEYKNQCAQAALLVFFSRNIVYPALARDENVEGTVVLSLVVEKDGYISSPTIIKEIGGGCGAEALRVANGMNDALKAAKLTWKAGETKGQPVRTQVNLPIKFKLQDPPDFVIADRDTVFVVLDDSLAFPGGQAALDQFVKSNLKYPAAYKDSCQIGTMDMTIRVSPDGYVKVLDLADYWNLGFDFQFEAIVAACATYRKWTPAKRNDRVVPASYELSVTFEPAANHCAQKKSDYEKALALADEGSSLFNEGKQEEGIIKLNEALKLFPSNANFLYLRGQAYMNMQKMAEACEDFQKVRSMVYIDVVNQLIPLICK